jgi:hypothetical protein
MVTATPLGLLRPVNDSTTADPAAVEDCWACPDVAVAVVAVAGVDADVPDDAVAVAPDAAEAAVVAAGAAAAGGVEEEPLLRTPPAPQAALPAVAMTIATVPAILVNRRQAREEITSSTLFRSKIG